MKKKSNTIKRLESLLSQKNIKEAHEEANEIIFKIKLANLRESQGLKQEDIKNFSQSSISQIENRKDIKLSTLKNYLHGIGMELEIKTRPIGSRSLKKEIVLMKD